MSRLVNIGINTARGFVTPVLNFLIIILGIRQFGKEDWGTLIHILVWVSLLSFVMNWGSKDYLIRQYSNNPAKANDYFYSGFFSRNLLFPLSLILLFFFPLPISLAAMTLVMLSHCYASFDSLIIYHQKFFTQLIAEVLGFVVLLAGIYAVHTFTLLFFLELYCLSYLLKTACLFFSLRMWKITGAIEVSIVQFRESLPFFLLGLSGLIGSRADIYVVNSLLPKDQISDYQLIKTSFLMLMSVSGFIIGPLNKQFYRSQDETITKLRTIFKKMAFPTLILGGIALWLVLEGWMKLAVSYPVYLVGLIASLPSFYCIIPVYNLYKRKHEKKVLKANILSACANIVLSMLLLSEFGILGAVIGFCLSQWLYLVLILKYEKVN